GSAAKISGHALECRVNAGASGTITRFSPPLGPSVRVDTHLCEHAVVSPHYDPMIAKVITHGPDRQRTIDSMIRALREFEIEGVQTNIASQITILQSKAFRSGTFGTDLYSRLFAEEKTR
ncbi:MAG TPA: acetyl-CoA carboxylase biotin carboxylase subunit, partial [Sphaerochaetaceae bacterium]|nr:acetyl-CoA carboxylase biotin carboxylase subunit [Sphaerochaetaceae bacterium]